MVVTALVENITLTEEFAGQHGLSYHISYDDRQILFDLGANHQFINHAIQKGIALSQIDCAIISHGHRDHGGGLKNFFSQNHKAPVYIRSDAFTPHYVIRSGRPWFAGLDITYKDHPQVVLVKEDSTIDEKAFIFSDVKGCRYLSQSNCVLFTEDNGSYLQDMFYHEQNLVISHKGKRVLFCGCAHNGIVNIQSQAEKLLGAPMTHVIGGFHLYNSFDKTSERKKLIADIGRYLQATKATYYTGHCTGIKAYNLLKECLGERIHYFHAGETLHLT